MLYANARLGLASHICQKTDKATMSVGLEIRAPLMNHQIADLAYTIPYKYMLKDGTTKSIFKKAVKG